jgi:hypothetical protein
MTSSPSDELLLRLLQLEKQVHNLPLPENVKIALNVLTLVLIAGFTCFYVYRKRGKIFATLTSAPTATTGVDAADLYRELLKVGNILRVSNEAVATGSSPPPSPSAPVAGGVLSPPRTRSGS